MKKELILIILSILLATPSVRAVDDDGFAEFEDVSKDSSKNAKTPEAPTAEVKPAPPAGEPNPFTDVDELPAQNSPADLASPNNMTSGEVHKSPSATPEGAPTAPSPTFEPVPAPELHSESTTPSESPMEMQTKPSESNTETASSSGSGDSPDLNKEMRYHQIYQKYNQMPMSEAEWEQVVKDRKNETYQIQGGDTLWDLSKTLFGDGYYWPKVWSYNSSITNPHQISPGNYIHFYAGTSEAPPAVDITDKAEMPKDEELIENTQAIKVKPQDGISYEIPAARKHKQLTPLPPSLPRWSMLSAEPAVAQVTVEPLERKFNEANLNLNYFITENDPNSFGSVVETEVASMTSAADNQYVFVHLEGSSQGHYLVVDPKDQVKDFETGHTVNQMQVQGEIEVLNLVNTDKNIYRAIVKKSVNPVAVGAKLIGGSLPVFNMSQNGPRSSVSATIIGGSGVGFASRQFGVQNIVYINAGSTQGLQDGNVLQVIANQAVRDPNTLVSQNYREIGLIKVVKTEGNYSTAVVVKSDDEIQIGDKTSMVASSSSFSAPSASSSEIPSSESEGSKDKGSSSGFDDFGVDPGSERTQPATSPSTPPANNDNSGEGMEF